MTDSVRGRLWLYYLAGMLALMGAYFLFPGESVAAGIIYTLGPTGAGVAIVTGIHLNRPKHRSPWYALAAGMFIYGAGNVVFATEPAFPSLADAMYLAAYALFAVSFFQLMIQRSAGRHQENVLDALVLASGGGVLAWVFLMEPYLELSELSVFGRAVSMSYPGMDVLLLAALAALVLTPGARTRAFMLLAAGMSSQLIVDIPYGLAQLDGTFTYGSPMFIFWFLEYALIGAAALHPSMVNVTTPAPDSQNQLQRWRLFALASAAMIPPVTLMIAAMSDYADANQSTVAVIAALSGLLFVLVIARVAGLMSEVTEHRRLQVLKDEFVSIVSHELRTPLTSIRGSLGLLVGGALASSPAKAERMLQIALDNTDRLVRLINDILDIERMGSGKGALHQRACSAEKLVTEANDAMHAAALEAGVSVDIDSTEGVVWADPDRVLQTLTNLLSNAIKFSPRGGMVRLGSSLRDGEVLFHVCDEGRGIPADMLEQVFERFHQLDSSDAREKGGTGLGLAICRSIVAQHGGRIWAESTEGQGSTFRFTLPAAPAEGNDESPDRGDTFRPRVLVCDDDADVREVLAAMLHHKGYDVIAVGSGEEAVQRAVADRPHAILLDILLPGMSGWDTAIALSLAPETLDIPIIMLSVVSPDEESPVAVVDWIAKPLEERTLFGALERALAGQGAIRRVLVVEDDPDLAQVLVALLERHGLEVAHAATGLAAVQLSAEMQPDLLILDVGLPDGDGFWVADWLRQHELLRSVPIVVYTARELDAHERERLDMGHTSFVTKGGVTLQQFEHDVIRLVAALAPLDRPVTHVG